MHMHGDQREITKVKFQLDKDKQKAERKSECFHKVPTVYTKIPEKQGKVESR